MTPVGEQLMQSWAFSALRWVIALAVSVWISIPFAIQALVVLMLIDVAIAILNPKTSIPARRMAITLLIVGGVHLIFGMAKTQTGLNLGFEVATPVCLFYCTTEILLIIRNSSPFVDWPPMFISKLQQYEGLTGKDKQELTKLSLKQGDNGVTLGLRFSPSKEDKHSGDV